MTELFRLGRVFEFPVSLAQEWSESDGPVFRQRPHPHQMFQMSNLGEFAVHQQTSIVYSQSSRGILKLMVNFFFFPPFFSKIEKIGIVLSRNLVDSGFTTFDMIGAAHPRDLERVSTSLILFYFSKLFKDNNNNKVFC